MPVEVAPKPASHALQDSHDSYRRALTSAMSRNFEDVRDACPEVARAAREYAAFLARNPKRSFRLVGLNDLELTISAGDKVFLEVKRQKICEFEAWIPPIQSGILIGIDGGQVKLQVPDEGVEELTKLALEGRSKALRVVIYETTP